MGFLDKYKEQSFTVEPAAAASKSRTFEVLVADTIAEQRQILGGAKIKTKVVNDVQRYKQGWWNESTGIVDARIGVTPIFGTTRFTLTKDQFAEFLDDLENGWSSDPDLKEAFAECKKKKEAQEEQRKRTMEKKKKEKEAAKG